MKNTVILLLFAILPLGFLKAQTLDPEPLSFTSASLVIYPEQTKFLLGWNHFQVSKAESEQVSSFFHLSPANFLTFSLANLFFVLSQKKQH